MRWSGLKIIALALVAMSVAAIIGLWQGLRTLEEEVFFDPADSQYLTDVESDVRLLAALAKGTSAKSPTVTEVKDAGRDGGVYLNALLQWNGLGARHHATALALPTALVTELSGQGRAWLHQDHSAALSRLDFSWMGPLSSFHYWDLESSGPYAEALEANPDLDPTLAPLPDLAILQAWVKARLLRASMDGDLSAAGSQVHQLAMLAISSERYVMIMAGISWLARLHEWQHDVSIQRPGTAWPWPELEILNLEKMSRGLTGLTGFLQPGTPATVVDRAFPPDASPDSARCAAVNERLPLLLLQRALLRPHYPELFTPIGSAIHRLRTGCRDSLAMRRWMQSSYIPVSLRGDILAQAGADSSAAPKGPTLSWHELRQQPWLSRLFGLVLTKSARTDPLAAYRRLTRVQNRPGT